MDRKKFIQTGGRLMLLGGIIAASGYLIKNNRVTASCSVSPTCGNCGRLSKCSLPQATEFVAKNNEHKDSKSLSN